MSDIDKQLDEILDEMLRVEFESKPPSLPLSIPREAREAMRLKPKRQLKALIEREKARAYHNGRYDLAHGMIPVFEKELTKFKDTQDE